MNRRKPSMDASKFWERPVLKKLGTVRDIAQGNGNGGGNGNGNACNNPGKGRPPFCS